MRVHNKTIEKMVYQALKVISNSTSIFCKKKGWKKVYGTRPLMFK